jgi:hypothetical protein
MGLSHYSKRDDLNLPVIACKRQVKPESAFQKPEGIWVSVDGDGDWPEWCQAEGFGLDGLLYRYPVAPSLDAKILWLSHVAELRQFQERYGIDLRLGSYIDTAIDWPRVALDFQGIVIAPYCWEMRMGAHWYYTWDCASGCIWDTKAIQSFGPPIRTELYAVRHKES